ncbi:MAG TPA: hypothetical protein VGP36_03705 [Mycobacteriales bacterium]|jgi:hypothetical protein|nr:hypothetical protein [Mycobacteriales bacterium]
MAQSRARPLSRAEAAMATLLAYLVLLISLAGTRLGGHSDGTDPGQRLRIVADSRSLTAMVDPIARFAPVSTCVGPSTVPYAHAAAPGITEPLAFGPPVEGRTPLSAAAVNGVLIQRLCGGPETPGGPVRAPDRRLFAAIDAAVNGTDPNRPLTQSQWAAGVNQLISSDGRFVAARVETLAVRAGSGTYGMKARAGADPLVIATRLAHDDTSRYLLLPVRARDDKVVTLTLRLRCGFQPVFS